MTRLDFLLKTFATNTEQMKVMLGTQQTIVDTLGEKKEWVVLTDEEIEKLLDEMSLGCCARDVLIVQEKLKEKNNAG
jgi:hypothetical protein